MRIVAAILGIALMVVGGAAIHFWREAEAGRQQVAALQAQLQERESRPVAANVTPAALTAAPAAATAPAATPPAAAQVSPAAQSLAVAGLPSIEALRVQMESPEGVARRKLLTRSLMETSNPDVAEALGLAPDEEQKLLDLLADHQNSTSAVFSNNAANAAVSAQDRAAALRDQQQANEAELQSLLGSKYPQWQDYAQTRRAWQQRRDLRAVLDAAGTPLSDAQGKSLVTALAAEQRIINQQRAAAPGMSFAEAMTQYTPERRQRLLDVAAPHLSAQQLEGYRGMLERAAVQEQSLIGPIRAASEAAAAASAGTR